jgi:DNA ligase-4
MQSFDLIVIGGYYGEGKRRMNSASNDWCDHINSFLVGVTKKIDLENPKNSIILPLVKVGGGISYEEYDLLRNRLKKHWIKYDSKNPPTMFGKWNPAISERPDVYIDDPSISILVEVKAAEIVKFRLIYYFLDSV